MTDLQSFRAELHVHTVLSPCAEVEMIPQLIVQESIQRGIDLIAITDHNASANVAAVQKAAGGTLLHVLPGMELQTREEVHVLCLFDTISQLDSLQEIISAALPDKNNSPEFFGEQYIVDESGQLIAIEEQLLITSADLTFEQSWEIVTKLGGLFIPAHIDNQSFSVLSNLGMIPEHVSVEAVEVTRHMNIEEVPVRYPQVKGIPVIKNGDAHRLNELLGASTFLLASPTIAEIRLALRGGNGRVLQTS